MNWKIKENKKLIQGILAIKTENEAVRFLRDLMTKKEIKAFAKRLKTAEMLENKMSYSTIQKETGLSSTTIARVSMWLNGKQGGYKLILNRLHHNNTQLQRELS